MIKMLSDVGRALVVGGALATIGGITYLGFLLGHWQESTSGTMNARMTLAGYPATFDGYPITPTELVYAALGLGLGIIVAAVTFGTIATFYDIRDSLRTIARMQLNSPNRFGGAGPSIGPRRDPTFD